MKLKKHGAFLVNFVIGFANGDMSRREFDMDNSGYVIEHFRNLNESILVFPGGLRIRLNVPIPPAPGWQTMRSGTPLVMPWMHSWAMHL